MAKLTKMVSAIGSLKDLNSPRTEFDDGSKTIPAEAAFPPADIRPTPGDARTLMLRVTNSGNLAEAAPGPRTNAQGDTFSRLACQQARSDVTKPCISPAGRSG